MSLVSALVVMTAAAGLTPLVTRRLGRDTGYVLAAAFIVATALLAGAVPTVLAGGVVRVSWRWLPAFDASAGLRMDGLALLFCLLVLGVGALILTYCPRYLEPGERYTHTYVVLVLFATAMLGLVLAADLVVLFVFWEITSICSFYLIASGGPDAGPPAGRALIVTASGGLALLAAVVLIGVATGTTDLDVLLTEPRLLLDSPVAWPAGALLLVAALTKSAQVPFHFWLPDAMVAITPVSAYLHAATMVKAGIYLLLRFSPVYGEQPAWGLTLIGVGLVTAVLGALLALKQRDLKALLAYSTVSQLGLMVAASGVGTRAGLAAATLHVFAHALFKATLFMLVGIIDHQAGSRDVAELSGLRRVMPVTAVLTALAAMSLAGVPPLLGFVSKEALFGAFLDVRGVVWLSVVAAGLAVTASVLTFAYGARLVHGAFGGPVRQRRLAEPGPAFLAPAAVAALAGLLLGVLVPVLDPLMAPAVAALAGRREVHLSLWHGFTPAMWLSVTTIAAGMLLFAARTPVDAWMRRVMVAPRGGELVSQAYQALIRFGGAVGRPDIAGSLSGHLLRPLLLLIVAGAAGMVALGGPPPRPGPVTRPADWVVLALLVPAVAGLVAARRRVGLVVLLGSTGLVVGVWFLLAGAPDVALTLLLVEVLTAVIAMLVLRTLAPGFSPARPRRVLATAVVALAAGAAAGSATWAMTGRRPLSPVGETLLRTTEPATGGHNVVNLILVEFRAFDTLGEASVLVAAALGLLLLYGPQRGARRRRAAPAAGRGMPPDADLLAGTVVLPAANRLLGPVMLLLSAYLFLRGHQEPGGGFAAALIAGGAVGLAFLADGGETTPRWARAAPLLAGGLLLAAGSGLASLPAGRPLLTPWHAELGGLPLSTSLVFDLGVFLAVLGLVTTAIDRFGDSHGAPR